jgi:membrane-associated phospholipid phosphatase
MALSYERRSLTDESFRRDLDQGHFVGGRDGTVGLISRHGGLLRTLLPGAATALGLICLFVWVSGSVAAADGSAGLDRPALAAGKSVRSPVLDVLVTAYAFLGDTVGMPVLVVTAAGILAIRWRSWIPVTHMVSASAGSLLTTIAGKRLVARIRPPLLEAVPPYDFSASFPSGHALNSVVIAGMIAYLITLRVDTTRSRVLAASVAWLFAVTMGLSGVYLGHHWLTDVLAGWALGGAWLVIVITAHRAYLTIGTARPTTSG